MRNGSEMVSVISEYVTREFGPELHALTLQTLNLDEELWAEAAKYVDGTPGFQADIRRKLRNQAVIKLYEERYDRYYSMQSYLLTKLLMKTADSMSYFGNLKVPGEQTILGEAPEDKVFSL